VYAEHRHGSLRVLETPHTQNYINARLREVDERLFLERQLTVADRYPVWCVCLTLRGEPPMCIYEHRTDDGTPIGYPTEAIVEKVREMKQSGPVDARELDRRNQAKRDERRRTAYSKIPEMAKDMARLSTKELPALRGGSPKILADRRAKRTDGFWERAEALNL
jgi:hypothetical protein